jgi:hypothetical protein
MIEWLQLTEKRRIEILNTASNQICIVALILLQYNAKIGFILLQK